MTAYEDYIASKSIVVEPSGIADPPALSDRLFPFQRETSLWALRRGKAAIWADCGLGKSWMALEWSRVVAELGPVLLHTPLAVARQFVSEHAKLGSDVPIRIVREAREVGEGINVCNYERMHLLDPSVFAGVVLDESSILKDHTAKTRQSLVESFTATPFRLCCTATPSPNDVMELANHAEFLGVMTRAEMLAKFFVHDGGQTQKWRLKGHAREDFWRWVCSWAVSIRRPSDLGYSDGGYELPPLRMHEHVVSVDGMARSQGTLFAVQARGLTEQRQARSMSLDARVRIAADLANGDREPWLLWCDLNAESKALAAAVPDAVEVTGSDSPDVKEERMHDFTIGKTRVLVSKPSIAGWGMNWQHCSRVAFVGLSNSFEAWYQAIRRSYRFGQRSPVDCHMIASDAEQGVAENLHRKQLAAEEMAASMTQHMRLHGLAAERGGRDSYDPRVPMAIPSWLRSENAA